MRDLSYSLHDDGGPDMKRDRAGEPKLTAVGACGNRHFLKYQLVPRMVAEIRRRVLIKQPVEGNLRIPRYCSMYYVREDGGYNCAQVMRGGPPLYLMLPCWGNRGEGGGGGGGDRGVRPLSVARSCILLMNNLAGGRSRVLLGARGWNCAQPGLHGGLHHLQQHLGRIVHSHRR